jgi:hypothetical protein
VGQLVLCRVLDGGVRCRDVFRESSSSGSWICHVHGVSCAGHDSNHSQEASAGREAVMSPELTSGIILAVLVAMSVAVFMCGKKVGEIDGFVQGFNMAQKYAQERKEAVLNDMIDARIPLEQYHKFKARLEGESQSG